MSAFGRRLFGKRLAVFDVFNTLLMAFVLFITVFPFVYLVSISISDQYLVATNQVVFYPKGLDLSPYRVVFEDTRIWRSYRNTIVYTIVGTTLNTMATTLLAYGLAKRGLPLRKIITPLITFTMMFKGGIVPLYLVVQKLGMVNSMWAVILPGLVSVFNLMIVRTFFIGLPDSIMESAHLDGAGELTIFLRIALPLSLPAILTIGLYYAVHHWNTFFKALIFLNDPRKYTLQLILRNIVVAGQIESELDDDIMIVNESIKGATILVATVPILCVYPFIQKYFVKGAMIGAVKG